MKKNKIITMLLIIISVTMIGTMVKATIDTGYYNVTFNPNEATHITNFAKTIINVFAVIGTVVAVITLIIMGIKYMTGTIEEKAEYKKTMIPYLIGAIMMFGITQILNLIAKMVDSLK